MGSCCSVTNRVEASDQRTARRKRRREKWASDALDRQLSRSSQTDLDLREELLITHTTPGSVSEVTDFEEIIQVRFTELISAWRMCDKKKYWNTVTAKTNGFLTDSSLKRLIIVLVAFVHKNNGTVKPDDFHTDTDFLSGVKRLSKVIQKGMHQDELHCDFTHFDGCNKEWFQEWEEIEFDASPIFQE